MLDVGKVDEDDQKVQISSYRINNVQHDNNCSRTCVKVFETVNPKSSHHKTKQIFKFCIFKR